MLNVFWKPLTDALRDDPWRPWVWATIPLAFVTGFLWAQEPIPMGGWGMALLALLGLACVGGMAWMDEHAGAEIFASQHITPLSKLGLIYGLTAMLVVPLRPLLPDMVSTALLGMGLSGFILGAALATRYVVAAVRLRH